MKTEMEMVRAFQEKLDVSRTVLLGDLPPLMPGSDDHRMLQRVARELSSWTDRLERRLEEGGDRRVLRAHLMVEELEEVLYAMIVGDEELLLDGLADLIFVVVGTAVTFDLPLDGAFVEVARSNMTKEKQLKDPAKDRVRQKGPNYDPPRIADILKRYRER